MQDQLYEYYFTIGYHKTKSIDGSSRGSSLTFPLNSSLVAFPLFWLLDLSSGPPTLEPSMAFLFNLNKLYGHQVLN